MEMVSILSSKSVGAIEWQTIQKRAKTSSSTRSGAIEESLPLSIWPLMQIFRNSPSGYLSSADWKQAAKFPPKMPTKK